MSELSLISQQLPEIRQKKDKRREASTGEDSFCGHSAPLIASQTPLPAFSLCTAAATMGCACRGRLPLSSAHPRSPEPTGGMAAAVCGRASPRRSTLVEHLYTHTGEKPSPFRDCGKGFSQASSSGGKTAIPPGNGLTAARTKPAFTQRSGAHHPPPGPRARSPTSLR